jgi:hypothetical protein
MMQVKLKNTCPRAILTIAIVNHIQVLVAKVVSLRNNLNNYKMAFNDLAANQMVAYNHIKWRVYIDEQTNTLQMMTKDMAFIVYNLSPTTGSNDILGNQLMQKKFWLVAQIYTSRKSYCRK